MVATPRPTGSCRPPVAAPMRAANGCTAAPEASPHTASSVAYPIASAPVDEATSAGTTANAMPAQPKTQGAAGTTTAMKRRRTLAGGRPARAPRAGGRVSGASASGMHVSSVSTTWITYGSTVGAGPHCAIEPATAGPRPKPAVRVREARRAATGAGTADRGGTHSSLIHELPTTMAAATLSPLMNRPADSTTSDPAPTASTALPAQPSATPATSSGLRPKRSDSGPTTRKPGMIPTMYTANSRSTSTCVYPRRSR